jgi:hypothetical protein
MLTVALRPHDDSDRALVAEIRGDNAARTFHYANAAKWYGTLGAYTFDTDVNFTMFYPHLGVHMRR